ncbi:MAG TPA: alpha-hydroxy acid oxidase [Gaiellaceae bacterium]|nr:alpha-hydroxy acid oxidase [Gaiellaceae bacterium]
MTQLLNVLDYEAAAAERLDAGPFGYFSGGAGDERTLRDNVEAYRRHLLRPRVLVDVAGCTTQTTVLGQPVSMPLLVAPVAFQRLAHPDGEPATARAARDAGTIMCLSTIATSTPEEVAATGAPRWFQLYVLRDEGVTRELVARARDNGFAALVLTVDAPVPGARERDRRSGFMIPPHLTVAALGRGDLSPAEVLGQVSPSLTWTDVERLASESGLPVLLKGIQTPEDARLACEHGAAAIVVSNHGGRQLDGVAATLDLLPGIAEAVDGRIEVLVDGGVRRGADVVKALALGARAVLAGRAVIWGLAVDGENGVRSVLELLHAEIQNALQLLGCSSPADVRPEHIAPRVP